MEVVDMSQDLNKAMHTAFLSKTAPMLLADDFGDTDAATPFGSAEQSFDLDLDVATEV
jgi:hypothetical protein